LHQVDPPLRIHQLRIGRDNQITVDVVHLQNLTRFRGLNQRLASRDWWKREST
jgi:hypothetical protein